jgi:uncharacterized membrane protein YccF (DUF307 family)
MISQSRLNVKQNPAWRTYSRLVMIFYFPFGLLLTILGVFQVVGLFVSIIGIPAAMVVAKSLGTFLNPVNKICVSSAVTDELERRKASAYVDKHLGSM